jgi:ElaB/YqjD/DUF883 family membrane-anchored ribosome-binding protein
VAAILTCVKAVKPLESRAKSNGGAAASPTVRSIQQTGTGVMFKSSELGSELQALKSELSSLMSASADDMLHAAKNRTEAIAEQIKDALNELGETLSAEEVRVEKLIVERPIAALASAFALGVAVGLMLKRH